ncbi:MULTISPECIES: type I toxin-antitoxin system Fst family toxin [Lacticaseibacillus]|uniref:Type I toxin-antitoxin system Fst family toxin n=1 Tax=Lacticaseibacillus manihotivorans TaxID=88233 RepID=A0A5P8JV97_9LACO|nr:type I toxin-antitoxin system Fst family toxin [Lacticaseibacillus manihotivorans]QFQ90740.1 type I toxin-antitoxin system Fst family toxin [Lacticaseibacillus manihotivorans]QFQ93063.1 type I toxin-antitoxin system Fst family toxin [Lacticaseibacillus manihotivorans]
MSSFLSEVIAPIVVGIVIATYADWLDRHR